MVNIISPFSIIDINMQKHATSKLDNCTAIMAQKKVHWLKLRYDNCLKVHIMLPKIYLHENKHDNSVVGPIGARGDYVGTTWVGSRDDVYLSYFR